MDRNWKCPSETGLPEGASASSLLAVLARPCPLPGAPGLGAASALLCAWLLLHSQEPAGSPLSGTGCFSSYMTLSPCLFTCLESVGPVRTLALSRPVFPMACSGDLPLGPARDSQQPTAGSAAHIQQSRSVRARPLGTLVGRHTSCPAV